MTTMSSEIEKLERELIRTATVRLRSRVMAIVFGMVGGTGLLVATLWLVARGGLEVGLHLELLSNFFPGYSVTGCGAVIRFGYGAVLGSIVGWSVAWIYNQLVERREAS